MTTTTAGRATVQDYYGHVLKTKADLKTSACCSTESLPAHVRCIASLIEAEIQEKFYGCGSPIPPGLEGCTVLDLGCGTGRDAYLLSKLVGPTGRVIGVDMTDEQLDVARRHRDTHMRRFGFACSNVEFVKAYMEDLDEIGIANDSVDVVVSNCVINLSFDKQRLLEQIHRVLKPGGELFFSDIFTSRRIPSANRDNAVLIGECIAGAYYVEDFRRAMIQAGFPDFRRYSTREVAVHDPAIRSLIGPTRLYSETIRTFKIASLEDRCEDYGQHATYRGTMAEDPHQFILDDHHLFETGRPMLVCGNTAAMLAETRYEKHFEVAGDRSRHFGLFDCDRTHLPQAASSTPGACC